MGDFPAVAFWNWRQPSTDWFNLATGEALAEYNPSPAMRELVAGIESQEKAMKKSRGEYVALPARFNLPTGEAEVKKRRPRMRADSHLSESAGEIVHITVETLAPTRSRTAPTREILNQNVLSLTSVRLHDRQLIEISNPNVLILHRHVKRTIKLAK